MTPLSKRPTLRLGDTGNCVRTLKNLLLTKGWSLGYTPPNGTFDAATAAMLADWQRANGQKVVATVSSRTWAAIAASRAKPGYTLTRGPNESPRIVLGFDDCFRDWADAQSAILTAESNNVAIVLFPWANCAGTYLSELARAHGSYVFNHTISHVDLTTLSYDQAYLELGAPGIVTDYGRPPFGGINDTVASAYAARSMQPWTWTYDTEDTLGTPQDQLVAQVVNNATTGTTFVMHMHGSAFNGASIQAIVDGLAKRGLALCRNYGSTTPEVPTFVC